MVSSKDRCWRWFFFSFAKQFVSRGGPLSGDTERPPIIYSFHKGKPSTRERERERGLSLAGSRPATEQNASRVFVALVLGRFICDRRWGSVWSDRHQINSNAQQFWRKETEAQGKNSSRSSVVSSDLSVPFQRSFQSGPRTVVRKTR